jgi:predicted PurR-regulated permease PerM
MGSQPPSAPSPDSTSTPATRPGRRRALAVVLALSFLAAAWVVAPLYVGLLLGTVMAFSAHPLFRALVRRLGRRALAAALTTGVGGTVMLAGSVALVVVLGREILRAVELAKHSLTGATVESLLGSTGARILDALEVDRAQAISYAQEELGKLSGRIASAASVLVSATASAILTAVIALFAMYYVTLEWSQLAMRIERVLPLDPKYTRALVSEFRHVARSAFVGTVATGLVQGVFAGIGFVIAGLPQAFAWGLLTSVASVIPVFGTSLVWAPAAAFLLIEGHPVAAAFVVVWGLVVVMAVSDYVVRPRLVGGKQEAHPLLMLLSLLGGIKVFGLAGLIVGPVVVSLFLAILRIYEREVGEGALSANATAEPAGPDS